MTYDDWKTTDDTPQPEPNRCDKCGHPENYCDCACCVERARDEDDALPYECDGDCVNPQLHKPPDSGRPA